MKKPLFLLLIGFIALQLLVPSYMIFRNYDTLMTGEGYKFVVHTYYPNDPFRGRYVELRPDVMTYKTYAVLGRDEQGYAIISDSSDKPPLSGVYAKNLRLGRYYINERMAPIAERIQWELSEDDNLYLLVKVKSGHYVIEGLYLNDIPIEQHISEGPRILYS